MLGFNGFFLGLSGLSRAQISIFFTNATFAPAINQATMDEEPEIENDKKVVHVRIKLSYKIYNNH